MTDKRRKLTDEQRQEVLTRYQSLDRMENIASDFQVTRQTIFKILKKSGIDTTKSQRIKRTCPVCGTEVLRVRCRARKTASSYCSETCYHIWLETLGEDYKPSSYYSRVAREVITKYFDYHPEEGHRIHHINKDCSDNRKINLMVFPTQGTHVRYHRGFDEKPIWDGRN